MEGSIVPVPFSSAQIAQWRTHNFGAIFLVKMPLLLLMIGNFFILIICLMGAQSCYFKRNWKWFWLMLVCVLLSSGGIATVVYEWMGPYGPTDLPAAVIRNPTSPL
jgi:glucan phosphoethanolaminetransferase (alkaline phosphatase superfamily)